MPGHRRGRSLSEGLTLEESEDGGLVISSINDDSSANQGLKEGDEIVGAAINFDELSKDDVLKVLKLMEPFDDKITFLTKNNLSKSLGNLGVKGPEEMLKDSYSRLYNNKIKKYMKDDSPDRPAGAEGGSVGVELKARRTTPNWSKPRLKKDTGMPRLGVDFAVPKTKTPSVDIPTSFQSGDVTFSVPESGDVYQTNANISTPNLSLPRGLNGALEGDSNASLSGRNLSHPLPSLGLKGPAGNGAIQGPRLTMDASSSDLNVPYLQQSGTLPEGPAINSKGGVKLPNIEGPSVDLKIPDLERPQIGLRNGGVLSADMALPNADFPSIEGPDVNIPDVGVNPSEGNISGPTFDINAPKLDIDGTKKFKMPKFKIPDLGLSEPMLSGPDFEARMPDISAPDVALKGSELDFKMPEVKMPSGKVRVRSSKKLKNPDLNVDNPSIHTELPRLKRLGLDVDTDIGVKTPNMDLQTPSIDAPDLSLPDVGSSSGKLKMPGLKKPDFGLPEPDYELKTPDLDLSAPNFNGGIRPPYLNAPKLDLNASDVNINKPSGKLNLDADAPSGKLKMPKFKLFGTLPKKKDLDINAGLNSTNLSLTGPKIKGMDAPDVNLPNMDLKAPKLDFNSPDVNIGSPKGKFKMPKLKMPNFDLPKGPNVDIDGDLDRPDLRLPSGRLNADLSKPELDINAPSLNLKGPKTKLDMPDVDIGSTSGKFKVPSFKMPDFGLSGPNMKGPDYDLKTPNLDLSIPKFKGGIDTPDFNMPKISLKNPKLDLNAPDVNLDMPSGEVNVPRLKKPNMGLNAPDMNIDAPSGKLKMPKFGLSGTLPKGPNLDINTDLKSPDLSLRAPKIKGGIDAPDFDLPNMDLKAPKFGVNTPDVNIGSPKGKFKMPKLKMPKFSFPSLKGPDVDIDGDIDGPDIDINAPRVNLKGPKAGLEMPDVGFGSPSAKFNKPNLKMPDFGLSGPNIKGPNFDLKSPNLDLSGPKLSGGISPPDLNMPKVDIKRPKLDLNAPDVNFDMPSGKLKVPTLKTPKTKFNTPDFDIDAPSGKLKMPKFGLSGTLPKGPNLDINTDLKSPDWSLRAPKIKGGIDAPDLNLPNMDLKAPKFGVNTPDVNIGSPKGKFKMPKLKMPKFSFPSLKGPDVDIDGDIDSPDIDINAPRVNLKGPKAGLEKPDVRFGSPSGKFKKPKMKMPDVGLSGPKLEGPNFDLKSPDLDLALPKGPKLDINTNLKTPDLSLKAPKIKGGYAAPDLDLPHMDLKTPKFNVNTPGINSPHLDLPNASLKGPKLDLGAPKFDIDTPDMNIGSPSGKVKMPNMPNLGFSGLKGPDLGIDGNMPQFGSPDLRAGSNLDVDAALRTPDMDISPLNTKVNMKPPRLRGNVAGPKLNAPNVDLGIPKADIWSQQFHIAAPDLDVDAPSMNIKGPSSKNRRSDTTGASMKMPDLDIDADVKLPHTDRRSRNPKVRSSYPYVDSDIPNHLKGSGPYLHAPDLNIDDFTGSEHVLRARGSSMDLDMPTVSSANNGTSLRASAPKLPPQKIDEQGYMVSHPDIRNDNRAHRQVPAGEIDTQTGRSRQQSTRQTQLNTTLPNLSRDAHRQGSADVDGYYVTVFPNQAQNGRMENRKSNTLGRRDLNPSNVDLDVPDGNDLKGSTFWFSKLI